VLKSIQDSQVIDDDTETKLKSVIDQFKQTGSY
jgi:hypothetical protein